MPPDAPVVAVVETALAACRNGTRDAAGGDVIILRLSKGNPVFMGYLLNHETVRRQRYRLAQGDSIVHIYERYLKDITIPFPPTNEQQEIARVLQNYDEEIDLYERKLSVLKQQKKGLMQKCSAATSLAKLAPITTKQSKPEMYILANLNSVGRRRWPFSPAPPPQ